MLTKIIQHLHLSNIAYSIEKAFLKKDATSLPSADEALAYLNTCSPDSHGSCICQHTFAEADCDLEVIVPCYNVERYVEECISSILSQKTHYSFFVTIINDGSTDGTADQLKQFADSPNVRIITQENRGFSGARNTGIAQAHGRYLMFVDSDDILRPGAIDNLMIAAERTGADVVDSAHIRFADRVQIEGVKQHLRTCLYDTIQRPQALPANDNSPCITGYVWGKVLRKELFHMVQFPLGYWLEDTLVWMILEPLCQHKVVISDVTFRYRMNPSSISHTSAGKMKSIDAIYVTLQLLKDREALGIKFDQPQYDMLLQQMRNNFGRVFSLPIEVQKAAFAVECDLICNRFKDWTTDNPRVRPIQDMLRNHDLALFQLWCKWR